MPNEQLRQIEIKLQRDEALSAEEREILLNILRELKDFRETLSEFEASHPQLVETINRICVMLANLGI